MKTIFFISLLLFPSLSQAQIVYVKCDDSKSKNILEEKIKASGYSVSQNTDSSNYVLVCNIWCTSKINSMYKGNVSILDQNGSTIAQSKDVRRGAVAVNGFNASSNIFGVIAEKQLPVLLKAISNKSENHE